jgi:chromosome segregation ATPase
MRAADIQRRRADTPPDIDELSSRLTALATRIDTLNGGRRPQRLRGNPADPAPPSLIDRLLAPEPENIRPAGRPPVEPTMAVHRDAAVHREPEERHWPRLPVPGDDVQAAPTPDFVQQISTQAIALREHEHRIAELTVIRDRQAHELQQARDHLERQALSIKSLRELTGERDSEVAELARKLVEAEADKVTLESQLATALREANNASVRLAANEGALSNRATDLSDANQLIEDLRAELATTQVAIATQVIAAEERLQRRYEDERSALLSNTERRIADLQSVIAERDERIAAAEQDKAALGEEIAALRALLNDSCTELEAAAETIAGKDSHIGFLDTVIKVTRDNGEATVKELAAEFDRERAAFERERQELIAKARNASAFQQDIAKLLPRLLERRAAA